MRLTQLADHLSDADLIGEDADVNTVQFDSRRAGPGAIFVAVPGFNVDGHDYLHVAVDAGATALCVQRDHEAKWRELSARAPTLVVPDTRIALATIAAALNGFPARELTVIGVTGTDGKTSVCHLITHVYQTLGEPVGLISTAGCRIGDETIGDSGRFTTPEAPEVQSMLRTMVDRGCRYAVVEATSHGLALHRLDHIEPDTAVFTNFGADHLDFHGSNEAYFAAKARLFEMLDTAANKGFSKLAIVNRDSVSRSQIREHTSAHIVTYAIDAHADVRAFDVSVDNWSATFKCMGLGINRPITLLQPGALSVYNALAALTTVCFTRPSHEWDAVAKAVESWPGAPGRMQLIDEGQPFTVVVDFAHAPDSLRRVLSLLRTRTPGRLIALFGCIGERERDRRPGMARAAAELADFTIVTDDNPYTEDRDAILTEIADALRAAGKQEGADFTVIPDRRDAIAHALKIAQSNDAVLLAGKGHETKVVLPGGEYDCNDAAIAREILRARR